MRVRFLQITILITMLLGGQKAFAGIEDIRLMIRISHGIFEVHCMDDTKETVTADYIREDRVCGGDASPQRRDKIVCTQNGVRAFFVTRIADGKLLGDALSSEQCRTVVQEAREGLVCTENGVKAFFVTRIADGELLGDSLSYEQCRTVVQEAREGLVCTQKGVRAFYITRIADEELLGDALSYNDCRTNITDIQATEDASSKGR